ncbi:MAG: TolC family protein [PVC group bacterium]|nr:TolC family protein [PVC group bacterium]
MQRKIIIKFIVSVVLSLGILSFPNSSCYAQSLAKLKKIYLKKTESSLQIFLEHSKSPVRFDVETSEKNLKLNVDIRGSKITFKEYENAPIEIPVNEQGVKRIILEEKFDHEQVPPQSVSMIVEMKQPFIYSLDSQWNDQFVVIEITPDDKVVSKTSRGSKVAATGPSQKIKKIRKIKDREAQKARKRLEAFTEKKRLESIQKETKEKLIKVRKQAQERVESGKPIKEAYEKLKTESKKRKISKVRKQSAENILYKDVSMPSESQPIIRRGTASETEIKSIEDCITIAMDKNITIQIAKEQRELSRLRVREARRAFYPAFLGQWRETDGKTVSEPYRGRSYGFQIEQALFSGGKLTATLRKEQLGELIAQGNLERMKQDVIFNVGKAYYEMVAAKKVVDQMRFLKEREVKILETVEKEFKIFSATPAILLTAQSLYNQVCFQVTSAEREFFLAKLKLEKAMFTENINIDGLNYHLPRRSITTKLDECMDLAFRNRPELKILQKSIEAAKYGEDIIRSEEFPNVSIIGNYGRSGEAFDQRELTLAKEWKLMGQVKWFLGGNTVESGYTRDQVTPYKITKTDTNLKSQSFDTKFSFWDNLAHFSKRKEAQITRKQAEKDLAEMRNKIKQEVEDAYYSYIKFNSQLGFSLNEIGFRRKQLEIAKTKKGMNEASGAEVMDSELQLAQANANYAQALAAINATIISLNRAIGVIGYFK